MTTTAGACDICVLQEDDFSHYEAAWRNFVTGQGWPAAHHSQEWVKTLGRGLKHQPIVLVARRGAEVAGVLPLLFLKSALFGKFLVSLPYVNWAGVVAVDDEVVGSLIERAVLLADELDVRFLELRQELEVAHPALTQRMTSKMQMRLSIDSGKDAVWKNLRSEVRTQVRKGERRGLSVHWGGEELLDDFYRIFARNMRDLGTPVFGRQVFREILERLSDQAELCVVRLEGLPVAASLAIHGPQITEVPSASALREYRETAANTFMYWRLIERALERGQSNFDFGRSTVGSSTYHFKIKWGAIPTPAVWQYYVRKGSAGQMRPENSKFRFAIWLWQKLPLPVANWIGPQIVRCIP